MHLTIIGAGYVGLVTGVCLAAKGHKITFIERSPERRAELEAGQMPIVEPGLDELFAEHRDSIRVSGRFSDAGPGDLTFVAVGTPIEDGESDLSQLRSTLDDLSAWPDAHISIRSTLPPGFSQRLPSLLNRPYPFRISTNPEFLRQGAAIADFLNPSRIVFGTFPETEESHLALVEEAYRDLPGPRLRVDVTSAELIKNISNAFLALKLSFVNETAALSEEYGADVEEVLTGIGMDPRIGTTYMRPGLGFGGSCLPKELQVVAVAGRKQGLAMHVARAAALVNSDQQDRFARRVLDALTRQESRIGLLGLSFKAGTDDLRGSPAITIAKRFVESGHDVVAFDPAVRPAHALSAVPDIILTTAPEEVFEGADAVVIATEWPQFRELNWPGLRQVMRGEWLFDGRNLLIAEEMLSLGYSYRGIGRGSNGRRLAPVA